MGEACGMRATDENCVCNCGLKKGDTTCEYLEVFIGCRWVDNIRMDLQEV